MIRYDDAVEPALRRALGYQNGADAVLDSRGWTVRCTPRCRTVMTSGVAGHTLFRKLHRGRGGEREWRRLGDLAAAGVAVPARVCVARSRGASLVVMRGVAGRCLEALLGEVAGDDPPARAAAQRYVEEQVLPLLSRLHRAGYCHRDFYTGHVFAQGLGAAAGAPVLIDVERVFRPRWRRARWRTKDLAALHASLPRWFSGPARLRLLRDYLGSLGPMGRRLARAVDRKAGRMRQRRPRFG
ncbi:MAG: lipopolysaccharide kinase InaA family protein [Planctomycetota bacterium]